MAIVINKRNVRVLVITNLLLIVVFFVLRNSNASVNESITTHHPDSLVTFDNSGNAPGTHQSVHDTVNTQDKEAEEVDKNSGDAEFDAAAEYNKIMEQSPMIVFSKTGCPYSKKLKALLTNSYTFSPSYHVVELDRHEHTKELQDQIEKVTGRRTVPNVIIGGTSRGGYTEIAELHKNDELLDSFKKWSDGAFTVKANSQSENS
ncbi:BGP_1a_G0002000.mRNA.1.CDS.1 [Saccharomyces cerevisiae]|nr:BGP_1a_G0002000.mRNA.1.CDS.1 [Saccharomyces cerevisiae]CAI7040526.1 BGP_1a_G0002000.mRNA.1.CDS.1 [Saccharomyces cerevisiae]